MTTVDKNVLSKAIGTAVKAVGANPVLPLLSNILFESNNGNSRVAGTNLELGISYTFPSKGEEFRTCIPAKVIASLVDAIHAEEVELEMDAKDQSIMIMTESSTSKIRCAPADEFPDIPVVEEPSFILPVAQFKEMIQRVAFASSNSGNQTSLEGVQLSVADGKLIMFAVDGFHLSYEETTLSEDNYSGKPVLIKGTTLEAISRTLPDEGDLEAQFEENKAMFHCGDVNVITQLMHGEFPDHRLLRETISEPTTTLTVYTMELLRAARQLRVFAAEIGTSKLEVRGMLVRHSIVTQEKGDADITFAAIRKGQDVSIGLNVHLLYEFLEICKTEYITIEIAGARSPILFRMKGVESFYHVIMPMGV